jgi:exopolysaccharide biosynthesis protein
MPDFRDQVLSEFTIRTKRQTTREFLDEQRQRGLSLLMATNAAPWSPFQSGITHPFADKMGLTISNGQLVCPSDGRPSFLVMKDGRLDLRIVDAETNLESIETAVSGFSFCLTDGKLGEVDTVLHPRTGFGLCREKRFLIILVVDGRQASSQGTTVRELGGWLKFFGAHHGLNMDGGGSTTLVQWDESGQRSEVINRPAHGERANGNNLGIYFLTESP